MQLEDLATKQDLELLKKELLLALTGRQDNEPAKEWLRSKEVKQLLNISNGTLQNLRVKGLLHPTKIEGVYYYRLAEIEALLNAGTEQ